MKRLLRRVVDLGINLIDTADRYGPEISENLIAEALHPYPAGLVVATKGGLRRSAPWRSQDARPERLRECCEASLRRLRLDCIDLYQLHALDPAVALEESVGALRELQRQGKIRHIGLCNVSVDELERAQRIVGIATVQNRYNLEDRRSEDVLRACEQRGLVFMPWFPLGDGRLAASGGPLDVLARSRGVTAAQVALTWLLQRSPVTLPIPGTSSVGHLEENAAAARLHLSDEVMEQLERFPHRGVRRWPEERSG